MPRPHPFLVVGYDGSPAARAAVSLALDAVGTAGHLCLVRTYAVADDAGDALHYGDRLEEAADEAAQSIAALVNSDARFAFVDWESVIALGAPADVLVRVATEREADGVYLGSRGPDGIDALRGSVAHAVLQHADRPVTITPARMVAAAETTS